MISFPIAERTIPMWDCPKCFEPIEEAFRECWNCGTTRDETTPEYEMCEPLGQSETESETFTQTSESETPPQVNVAISQPADFVFSTTQTLETHSIRQYLGIVAGEGGLTRSGSIEDIAQSIESLFDNNTDSKPDLSYHVLLNNAREVAFENMAEQAKKLNANGVIGINIEYQKLGDFFIMVIATGTAVHLEEK